MFGGAFCQDKCGANIKEVSSGRSPEGETRISSLKVSYRMVKGWGTIVISPFLHPGINKQIKEMNSKKVNIPFIRYFYVYGEKGGLAGCIVLNSFGFDVV